MRRRNTYSDSISFANWNQVLEYREDLEYFYEDGYGYPINYQQACTPLKNLFDNFEFVLFSSFMN